LRKIWFGERNDGVTPFLLPLDPDLEEGPNLVTFKREHAVEVQHQQWATDEGRAGSERRGFDSGRVLR